MPRIEPSSKTRPEAGQHLEGAAWIEAHYEAALASSQTGTFGYDRETGVCVWSDTLRNLFGVDESVAASCEAWLSLVHTDDLQAAQAALTDAALWRSGTFTFEHRTNHPVQGLRWLLLRGRVLTDSADNPGRMLGTVIDITDHKLGEQRLELRAQQQEAVAELGRHALAGQNLNELMTGIVGTIADLLDIEVCGIAELLPDAQELQLAAGIGWPAGHVENRARMALSASSVASFALWQDEPVFITDLQADDRFEYTRNLLGMGVRSGLSVVIHGQSGPWGILSCYSNQPARFTADDVNFVKSVANVLAAGIARSHWEQQLRGARGALESRVKERTAQLEVSNRELEAFAYSVSHDLRAPLRSMDGFSQVLVEDYGSQLDDTAQDYLLRIRKAAKRMGELIDDLLSLSRVSSCELHRSDMNLTAFVEGFTNDLAVREPARDVCIRLQPDVRVIADPNLVRIALENLLLNSWKFTRECQQAVIGFGVLPEQDRMVFFVQDNGIGFDMALADRLFSPFQRLHPARQFEGTGIGLATAQRIVHRHGGEIWADSEPGQGTTIFFTLEEASRQGSLPAE